MAHHEGAYALFVKLLDVFMAIVAHTRQGEKQCHSSINKVATVDKEVSDFSSHIGSYNLSTNDFGDFTKGIILVLHGYRKFPAKIKVFDELSHCDEK